MKKSLVMLIGVALLIMMVSPVFAAATMNPTSYTLTQTSQDGLITGFTSKPVSVYYTVNGESYYISIPGDITFGAQGDFIETEVNVTKVTLSGDRYVDVKVNSTHGWQLMQHSGDDVLEDEPGISYTMEKYENNAWRQISAEGSTNFISLLQVHGTSGQSAVKLKFTMIDNPPNTGSYKDQMTFVSEVLGSTAPVTP